MSRSWIGSGGNAFSRSALTSRVHVQWATYHDQPGTNWAGRGCCTAQLQSIHVAIIVA